MRTLTEFTTVSAAPRDKIILKLAKIWDKGWPVSLLEVSIATGDSGPVIVLSGEADLSSVTQLNEVLASQISAQTTRLTIDVTNLRSADPVTAQALMLAALIVKAQGGTVVLLNPQEPVVQVMDHLSTAETFTIRITVPPETRPLPAPAPVKRREARVNDRPPE